MPSQAEPRYLKDMMDKMRGNGGHSKGYAPKKHEKREQDKWSPVSRSICRNGYMFFKNRRTGEVDVKRIKYNPSMSFAATRHFFGYEFAHANR